MPTILCSLLLQSTPTPPINYYAAARIVASTDSNTPANTIPLSDAAESADVVFAANSDVIDSSKLNSMMSTLQFKAGTTESVDANSGIAAAVLICCPSSPI